MADGTIKDTTAIGRSAGIKRPVKVSPTSEKIIREISKKHAEMFKRLANR